MVNAWCNRMAYFALGALGALGVAAPALAGAWPMEPGRGQIISAVLADEASRGFDGDGNASVEIDFEKFELSAFIEHGLTERITLVARPAVQTVSIDRAGGVDEADGFSALDIGARLLVARSGGWVASLQGSAVFPGATENGVNADLGSGERGAEARLLAGYGWGDAARGGFAEAQSAYRARSGVDPDEARLDLTLGWRASADWSAIAQSFSIWSVPEGAPGDDYETHRLQLSVVRRLDERWSVQAGAFGAVAGRRAVDERAAFIAVWRRY